jgi:hypothetical protein
MTIESIFQPHDESLPVTYIVTGRLEDYRIDDVRQYWAPRTVEFETPASYYGRD